MHHDTFSPSSTESFDGMQQTLFVIPTNIGSVTYLWSTQKSVCGITISIRVEVGGSFELGKWELGWYGSLSVGSLHIFSHPSSWVYTKLT